MLIVGVAGGDRGIRGFLDGLDPKTGQRLWRLWTTAAPGEEGGNTWLIKDVYLHGGGYFDLRTLTKDQAARFRNSVLNGKNNMPPFRGALSPKEVDDLFAYVIAGETGK